MGVFMSFDIFLEKIKYKEPIVNTLIVSTFRGHNNGNVCGS
jgi:hypothetical protein